jgi:hypothetical protein
LTKTEEVIVNIKYKDIDQTFSGDAEQVWRGINKFFTKIIPPFELFNKIILTVDLENLIELCKDIIAIAPEGPVLLVNKNRLTDSETLNLHLLAIYISNKLGNDKDYLTKEELQLKLGKSSKITSTRLGELIREGYIIKNDEGNYKITTFGIKRFQDMILPEINEKV